MYLNYIYCCSAKFCVLNPAILEISKIQSFALGLKVSHAEFTHVQVGLKNELCWQQKSIFIVSGTLCIATQLTIDIFAHTFTWKYLAKNRIPSFEKKTLTLIWAILTALHMHFRIKNGKFQYLATTTSTQGSSLDAFLPLYIPQSLLVFPLTHVKGVFRDVPKLHLCWHVNFKSGRLWSQGWDLRGECD